MPSPSVSKEALDAIARYGTDASSDEKRKRAIEAIKRYNAAVPPERERTEYERFQAFMEDPAGLNEVMPSRPGGEAPVQMSDIRRGLERRRRQREATRAAAEEQRRREITDTITEAGRSLAQDRAKQADEQQWLPGVEETQSLTEYRKPLGQSLMKEAVNTLAEGTYRGGETLMRAGETYSAPIGFDDWFESAADIAKKNAEEAPTEFDSPVANMIREGGVSTVNSIIGRVPSMIGLAAATAGTGGLGPLAQLGVFALGSGATFSSAEYAQKINEVRDNAIAEGASEEEAEELAESMRTRLFAATSGAAEGGGEALGDIVLAPLMGIGPGRGAVSAPVKRGLKNVLKSAGKQYAKMAGVEVPSELATTAAQVEVSKKLNLPTESQLESLKHTAGVSAIQTVFTLILFGIPVNVANRIAERANENKPADNKPADKTNVMKAMREEIERLEKEEAKLQKKAESQGQENRADAEPSDAKSGVESGSVESVESESDDASEDYWTRIKRMGQSRRRLENIVERMETDEATEGEVSDTVAGETVAEEPTEKPQQTEETGAEAASAAGAPAQREIELIRSGLESGEMTNEQALNIAFQLEENDDPQSASAIESIVREREEREERQRKEREKRRKPRNKFLRPGDKPIEKVRWGQARITADIVRAEDGQLWVISRRGPKDNPDHPKLKQPISEDTYRKFKNHRGGVRGGTILTSADLERMPAVRALIGVDPESLSRATDLEYFENIYITPHESSSNTVGARKLFATKDTTKKGQFGLERKRTLEDAVEHYHDLEHQEIGNEDTNPVDYNISRGDELVELALNELRNAGDQSEVESRTMVEQALGKDDAMHGMTLEEIDDVERSGFETFALEQLHDELDLPEGSFRPTTHDVGDESFESFRAAQEIGEALGVNVLVVDATNSEAEQINGYYLAMENDLESGKTAGVVILNHNATNNHISVVMHEMVHQLRAKNPDLYDELARVIAEENPDALVQYRKDQGDRFLFSEESEIREEFIGDTLGERATDPRFWVRLQAKSPSLVERLSQLVARTLRRLKLKVSKKFRTSQYFKDIERIDEALTTALAEYKKRLTDGDVFMTTADKIVAEESARKTGAAQLKAKFEFNPETFLQRVQRLLQDKLNRLSYVQGQIEKAGNKIRDEHDAFMKAMNMPGRVGDRIRRFNDYLVDGKNSFVKRLSDAGFTVNEFGLYLYARHAHERNKRIRDIDPKAAQGNALKPPKGSGMTDEEASTILEAYEGTMIEDFAAEFDQTVVRSALNVRLESGLIDRETYDRLLDAYEYYVPLKGHPEIDAIRKNLGKGVSVTGKEFRRALGRRSMANNPFIQAIADYEEAVYRAEKNKVGRALLNLIRENPNEDFWSFRKLQYIPRYNSNGEMEYLDPQYPKDERHIHVKIDGKTYLIEIKDQALADGLLNLGMARTGKFFYVFNNYMRAVATYLSPEFVITNFSRDIQTAVTHIVGEHNTALAAKVLRDVPAAMRGIWSEVRSEDEADNHWAAIYADLKERGGRVGWTNMDTVAERQDKLEAKVRHFNQTGYGAVRTMKAVGKQIEDVNEVVEMGVRLAAYKNFIESGITRERAAMLAKDLTVDFNRKGQWGTALNALWLFSGASIQGTARIVRAYGVPGQGVARLAMKPFGKDTIKPLTRGQKRVRRICHGMVLASFMQSWLMRLYYPDEWEQYDDYTKDNYWLIPMPFGETHKSLAVKLPYGYNIFPVMGNVMEETINGDITTHEAFVRFLGAAQDAFNPLGGGSLAQFVSPTITDPFVQIYENKNFFGGPVRPEQSPYGDKRPRSQLYFNTVSGPSKAFTNWLHEISGGSALVSGYIEMSPESLDHMVQTLTGGVGKFALNALTTGQSLIRDGDFPKLNNIPMARQVIKEPSDWVGSQRVYELIDKYNTKIAPPKQLKRLIRNMQYAIQQGRMTPDTARRLLTQFIDRQKELALSLRIKEITDK